MNIFIEELKQNTKMLIIWSICLVGLIALGLCNYAAVGNATEQILDVVYVMPLVVSAMFGISNFNISTITGCYGALYLLIALITCSHAAALGALILSKEQRDRTFEFLYVKPVSRSGIVTSKLAAAVINILVINAVCFLSSLILARYAASENITNTLILLMPAMLIKQVIFLMLGLMMSVLCPSKQEATGVAIFFVMLMYILYILSNLSDTFGFLQPLKYVSPFRLFEAGELLKNGINVTYAAGAGAVILVFALITYVVHSKENFNA